MDAAKSEEGQSKLGLIYSGKILDVYGFGYIDLDNGKRNGP